MSHRPADDVGQLVRRGWQLRAAPRYVSVGADEHERQPVEPGDLLIVAWRGTLRSLNARSNPSSRSDSVKRSSTYPGPNRSSVDILGRIQACAARLLGSLLGRQSGVDLAGTVRYPDRRAVVESEVDFWCVELVVRAAARQPLVFEAM